MSVVKFWNKLLPAHNKTTETMKHQRRQNNLLHVWE